MCTCHPQSRHIVFCVFCCFTFCLVALHSTLSLDNGIVTLTDVIWTEPECLQSQGSLSKLMLT